VLRRLAIALSGTRREPSRGGIRDPLPSPSQAGVDEAKVRRAIDLSLEKYCSVHASLAPDTQSPTT
jgi:uncharacterized OsmC-like protein